MSDSDGAQRARQIDLSVQMQRHILAAVLKTPGTFARVRPVLIPDLFPDQAVSDILAWSVRHWDEHKQIPSKAALIDVFESHPDCMKTISRVYKEEIPDLEHTVQRIREYANKKAMVAAIIRAGRLLDAELDGKKLKDERGRDVLEDPLEIVRQASLVGRSIDSLGEVVFDPAVIAAIEDDTLNPKPEDLFYTGCTHLDEGGVTLERGEVGCVLGSTGTGKSHCLINTAIANLRRGRNVLYVNVEMPDKRIKKRFFTRIAGTSADIKGNPQDFFRRLRARLPKFNVGKLRLLNLISDVNSVDDIRTCLSQLRAEGEIIDLLVVDYVGILRPTNPTDKEHLQLAKLWLEFRSVCQEYNCAGWSGAQTNRSGEEAELVTKKAIAGSFALISHLDAGYSINMTVEEKDAGQGRFFIFKSRNDNDSGVIDFIFDYSRSLITTTGRHAAVAEKKRAGKKKSDEQQNEEAAFEAELAQRKGAKK